LPLAETFELVRFPLAITPASDDDDCFASICVWKLDVRPDT
jgi:hypothetical protein